MENLPEELVGGFYPYLDPESYRSFQQVGKRYTSIGEDPFYLKPVIVKASNGKWIIKTNPKGSCLNSLIYSSLRVLKEDDLVDGMFTYEYEFDNPEYTVIAQCPFDSDGYLSGMMNIEIFDPDGTVSLSYNISFVKGKAHGKAKFLDLVGRVHDFVFDHGVIVKPYYRDNTEPAYDEEDGFFTAEYYYIGDDISIYYINGIGIVKLVDFTNKRIFILTEEGDKYIVKTLGYEVLGEKSTNEVLAYLPKTLTNKIIPIYKDNLSDIILPMNLYNCSSIDKIEENINFLINRYRFYIIGIRMSMGI